MSGQESEQTRSHSQPDDIGTALPPLRSRRLRNFFHSQVGSRSPQQRWSTLFISTSSDNVRTIPESIQQLDPAPLSAVRRQGIVYEVRPETASTVRRISQLYGYRNQANRLQTLQELQEQLRREHQESRVFESPRPAPLPQANFTDPQRTSPFSGTAFTGECQLCCEEDVSLVFLLKDASTSTLRSSQTLNFPFAGGNLPENDIVSSFICCCDCSVYVVAQSETPIREKCAAALSLGSFRDNSEAWKDVLAIGLPHYPVSHREYLPLVFIAVVHETLEKSWAQLDGSEENALRRNALLWIKDILLDEVHLNGDGYEGCVNDWVFNIVLRPKNGWMSYIWTYPLQGFCLWLRIAAAKSGVDPSQLGVVVWKRIIIEITRSCKAFLIGNPLEDLTTKIEQFNKLILSSDGFEAWMGLLALEGLLQEEVMDAMDGLEQEKTWVLKNGRWAVVKWLEWVPSIDGQPRATAQLVDMIINEMGGEIIWETPQEITREWCLKPEAQIDDRRHHERDIEVMLESL